MLALQVMEEIIQKKKPLNITKWTRAKQNKKKL
jgi:hypothetical protein